MPAPASLRPTSLPTAPPPAPPEAEQAPAAVAPEVSEAAAEASAAATPAETLAPAAPWADGWLRAAALLPSLLALALYLRTAAPTITWRNGGDDSGDLVVAAATLGIPHPTGYPTYVVLGHLATWLPFGEVAYRLSLLSALSAALAVSLVGALVYLLARRSVGAPPALALLGALAGALAFGTSQLFWSQAAIPEVYALHLGFVSAIVFALVVWRAWGGERWLVAAAALLGLGLGNHVTLALLLPAALPLVLDRPAPWRDGALRRRVALAFAAGLAIYLYLPWRGAQFPPLLWGEPHHPAGLLAHVTGALYQRYLFLGAPGDALSRAAHVATLLVEQIGWPGFVLGVVGAWWLWQSDRRLAVAGLVIVVGSAFFAVNYYARDSEVYLLPLFAAWAVALGVGAPALARVAGEALRVERRWRVRLGLALAVAALLATALQVPQTYARVDASADLTARDFARDVLAALPPRAVLLSDSDAHTFSLWYAQDVLGLRPDVAIVDLRLVAWPWYRAGLERRHAGLALRSATTAAVVLDLLAAGPQGRPVYASGRLEAVASNLGASGPPYTVRAP
ncbi:MAG: DUF2723 domain-containing protein [Chloroflexi bacterium]|nr:DUF2723 domain-containing protein [Chloroflexota bacterium]